MNKELQVGDRVMDAKGNLGIVTMANAREICILWDNGMTGSFKREYLACNQIKEAQNDH